MDKHCGLVVDFNVLTLDQLLKINEYREIRDSVEELHMEEEKRRSETNKQ